MRSLLDTQALIWSVNEPERLTVSAIAAISDESNELYLSVASVWVPIAVAYADR